LSPVPSPKAGNSAGSGGGESAGAKQLEQKLQEQQKVQIYGIYFDFASAQIKPATLETGLVISVPSFINEGDKVRVSTETGEYQSRA